MAEIIVIGASGFVGSAVASHLQETGWGVLRATRRGNADLTIDLTSPETLRNAFRPTQVVVNAAGGVDDLVRDASFKPATPIEKGIKRFVAWYLRYQGEN